MTDAAKIQIAGWFYGKWGQRLADSNRHYFAVATQMRKQGIPLHVALIVLVGKDMANEPICERPGVRQGPASTPLGGYPPAHFRATEVTASIRPLPCSACTWPGSKPRQPQQSPNTNDVLDLAHSYFAAP